MNLKRLLEAIQLARDCAPPSTRNDPRGILRHVLRTRSVAELIEWYPPAVEDVSVQIGATSGRVLAVRLDRFGDGAGHKVPVVGGLLVRACLKRLAAKRGITCLVDGGNVCTGLALGYFARKYRLNAELIASRLFTDEVVNYIGLHSADRVTVRKAPATGLGREREFYKHLLDLIRRRQLSDGAVCLWHAKYGGTVLRILGEEVAARVPCEPDVVICCIGAGATLQGWARPIQRRFGCRPRLAVVEHELCPLLRIANTKRVVWDAPAGVDTSWLSAPPPGIPHFVLGPHYDELNPFISSETLASIDVVVRYTDAQWRAMSTTCRDAGLCVGNSSAVNLLAARSFANEGRVALTFIYEPLRDFYVDRLSISGVGAPRRHVDECARTA